MSLRGEQSEDLCDSLPREGVGRGYTRQAIAWMAKNPLPAATQPRRTPPEGENEALKSR
jgi:hypothetical protein